MGECNGMSNKDNEPPVDMSLIIENLEGDRDLIIMLVESFLEIIPEDLIELNAYIENSDAANINLKAHSLKSSVKSFGATRASELAFQLECMGRKSRLDNAKQVLSELEGEMKKIILFFKEEDWKGKL